MTGAASNRDLVQVRLGQVQRIQLAGLRRHTRLSTERFRDQGILLPQLA